MIKVLDIRPIIMLLVNILMIFIMHSINDMLSSYGIYLLVPVLFIAVPSIYLSLGKSIFVIATTALLVESILPMRGFSLVMIWLVAGGFIRTQRFRFRRVSFLETFLLFVVVNTLMIFMYGLFFFPRNVDFLAYVFRIFNDAFFSALFLIYTSAYVVLLHQSIFKILGLEIGLEKEEQC